MSDSPETPASGASWPRCALPAHWLGKIGMRLLGWRIEGELPETPRGVLIACPHTSNWDFVYMILLAWGLRVKLSWIGKHTLFRWPWGMFFRRMGGISVDRSAPHDTVATIAAQLRQREQMILAIAPEGTRSKREYWKSGFYHIAHTASVPVICGYLDFGRKVGGAGPHFVPTGNIGEEMDRIREFYADITPQCPEQLTPARLRDESPVNGVPA